MLNHTVPNSVFLLLCLHLQSHVPRGPDLSLPCPWISTSCRYADDASVRALRSQRRCSGRVKTCPSPVPSLQTRAVVSVPGKSFIILTSSHSTFEMLSSLMMSTSLIHRLHSLFITASRCRARRRRSDVVNVGSCIAVMNGKAVARRTERNSDPNSKM